MTNRFYHAKHEAAVITNVDITMPHKISLVAQPSTQEDTIEMICDIGNNKTATKSLPWKTNMDVERKALYTLWVPSVYLYSPPTCWATVFIVEMERWWNEEWWCLWIEDTIVPIHVYTNEQKKQKKNLYFIAFFPHKTQPHLNQVDILLKLKFIQLFYKLC